MTRTLGFVWLGSASLVSLSCLRMVDYQYDPPCEQKFDLSSDRNNCGACGLACDTNEACVSGTCQCSAYTPDRCDDGCVNLTSNQGNCGWCGNHCGKGFLCVKGACECSFQVCGNDCVHTATDTNNCGQCDNICPAGYLCTNGKCWSGKECIGTPQPCEERPDSTPQSCEAGGGCKYGYECRGGWRPCSFYNGGCDYCKLIVGCTPCSNDGLCKGQARCEDQGPLQCNDNFGCTMVSCTGVPTPCEDFSATNCESHKGCKRQYPPQ